MRLQAFPGYVITKPTKMEDLKTSAGIIVATSEKKRGRFEETQRGNVLDVCYKEVDLADLRDCETIMVGDEIIYGEFAGIESDLEGVRYRLLEIKDVRARIVR
jgi:co-chaperonin GroES (HSP10)